MKKERTDILFLALLMISAVIIRIALILHMNVMNGDGAVSALMAEQISGLKEFPIYFWFCHYGGCLMSYISAVLFRIFGTSTIAFNMTGALFSSIWVLLAIMIATKNLDRSGYLPAALFTVFPPYMVLYISVYIVPEILLFGTLLLLLLTKYSAGQRRDPGIFALLGIVSGMGLWVSPAITPFVPTILTVFLIKDKKIFTSRAIMIFTFFFITGLLPAIIYNIQYPGATFLRFAGRILDLDRGALNQADLKWVLAGRLLRRLADFPVFLMRIPALLYDLMGLPNTVLFFVSLAIAAKRMYTGYVKDRKIDMISILMIFVFWFAVFYALLVGGVSTRYALPLYAVFPFLAGSSLSLLKVKSRFFYTALILAVLSCNIYGIGNKSLNSKAYHYPRLIEWLEAKKLQYGYSDYGTAYITIFHSKEKILISPTLFHPTFSDRRPQYTSKVRNSENTFYVIDSTNYPLAGPKIEKQFRKLSVGFKKDIVEEFIIYHDFSRKVYPEELKGISDHTCPN